MAEPNGNDNPDSEVPTQSMTVSSDPPEQSPRLLFNPSIDIYETSEGLVLYADLPGVSADGLDLQVQDNRLALFGRVRNDLSDLDVIHEEYKVGDFLRSFILSDEVDHERISARLNNGVLRIELPRAKRAEPRRIEVTGD
ncbi:MAG: Hsp20/alpha crystallin family protein [Planctomycetaceae bacterium]|nr:Hsp20/alpha crystallin family protein [Planctomycetaceae bacterium]